MKRILAMRRFIAGVLVSSILLVLVFWNTDWDRIIGAFREANHLLLALSALITLAGLWLRARLWQVLFWPDHVEHDTLLDAVNIGYLANNVLPARAGDVLRSYLVAEWDSPSMPHALSTTIFERIWDSLLILGLFFALLPFQPIPQSGVRIGVIVGLGFAGVVMMLALVMWQRDLGRRWLTRILSLVPHIDGKEWADTLMELLDSFAIVRRPRVMLRVVAWSIPIWGGAIIAYWLVILAFGINVSPAVGALAITAAAFGLAAPSAPAGVGTFEGAVIGALLLVGIDADLARSVALALHAMNFITLSGAGLWSLVRRGLGYRDLVRQSALAQQVTTD